MSRGFYALRNGIRGRPAAFRAKLTVFFISIAIVIGPTPPGTGVIAPATCQHRGPATTALTRPDHIIRSYHITLKRA